MSQQQMAYTPLRQASERCHIQPRRLRSLVESGSVPGVRVGRIWGVDEGSLRQFLAQERAAQIPESAEWLGLREGFRLELVALARAESTVKAYIAKLNVFSRWCVAQQVSFLQAGRGDIVRFLADQHGRVARKTMADYLMTLRSLYRYACRQGLRQDEPTAGIPAIRQSRPQPKSPFSEDELRRLLACAGIARNRALLLVLMATGIRIGELAGMTTEDIDWDRALVLVHGKGAKDRFVALSPVVLQALRDYLGDREGAVWLRDDSQACGEPIKRESLWRIVKNIGQRAGVSKCYPHRFRHTYAHLFLSTGGDAGALQASLGHSSMTMTLFYAAAWSGRRALEAQRQVATAVIDRLENGGTPATAEGGTRHDDGNARAGEVRAPLERGAVVSIPQAADPSS